MDRPLDWKEGEEIKFQRFRAKVEERSIYGKSKIELVWREGAAPTDDSLSAAELDLLPNVPVSVAPHCFVHANSRGAWRLVTNPKALDMWNAVKEAGFDPCFFLMTICDEHQSGWYDLPLTKREKKLASLQSALRKIQCHLIGTPVADLPVGWYLETATGDPIPRSQTWGLPTRFKSIATISISDALDKFAKGLGDDELLRHSLDRRDDDQAIRKLTAIARRCLPDISITRVAKIVQTRCELFLGPDEVKDLRQLRRYASAARGHGEKLKKKN